MKYVVQNHVAAILFSIILPVPFFALEWSKTSGFTRSEFPLVLFIFMWANSAIFVCTLLSALEDLQAGAVQSNIAWFSLKVLILLLSGWAFVHIVIDQMPCFLGGNGC